MTSESQTTLRSTSSGSTQRRRRHHDLEEPHRMRMSRAVSHFYHSSAERPRSSRVSIPVKEGLPSDDNVSDGSSTENEMVEVNRRKDRKIHITEEESVLDKRIVRNSEARTPPRVIEDYPRPGRTSRSRRKSTADIVLPSSPRRSSSTRDLPLPLPRLKRSNTTTSYGTIPKVPTVLPASSGASSTKRNSFLGNFFGPPLQTHHEPKRLVECLACLSDDIPRYKSAKLKCGHRMCHPCLRRIFKLSVTDPAHMPPKCCTADHIPLKHVERLFDLNFKKNWNRKYQEFTTKNRIYCPGRRCGEWIKPGNILKEDGKKYGKCGRCKIKICCLCNGKWHVTKDCPKDEQTNALLEAAKKAGWQRCYSCRAMVELKEGCNHMTCRCTAEFCMICGLKWKSCNCPWFNYEAVRADFANDEGDRLNHMRAPVNAAAPRACSPPLVGRPLRPATGNYNDGMARHRQQDRQDEELARRLPVNAAAPRASSPPLVGRPLRPATGNYNDGMARHRQQDRQDEELARRLQRISVYNESEYDYRGGIGDIHGIGNGACHFMNQNYVRAPARNVLNGNHDQVQEAVNYVTGMRQARHPPQVPSDPPVSGIRGSLPRWPTEQPMPPRPPPGWPNGQQQPQQQMPPLLLLRRHTTREQEYNAAPPTGPTERVVPRRLRTDYASEAAVHTLSPTVRSPPPQLSVGEHRPSILAGLSGAGRYANRVRAWRAHVEPFAPAEGFLSMP